MDYYNDAAKAIVLMRPDAPPKTFSSAAPLVPSRLCLQMPLRLIEVLRNDGKVIRFVPRRALDDSYPDWHAGKDGTSVAAYTYATSTPRTSISTRAPPPR